MLWKTLTGWNGIFADSTITVTIPFEKSEFNKQNATVNATVKLTESETMIFDTIDNPTITLFDEALFFN